MCVVAEEGIANLIYDIVEQRCQLRNGVHGGKKKKGVDDLPLPHANPHTHFCNGHFMHVSVVNLHNGNKMDAETMLFK